MSPGISGTQEENKAVASAGPSQTPTLARSLAAEPGGAASNRRRQRRSRTRLAYSAMTRTAAAASPRELWITMAELTVRSRNPRDAAADDEPWRQLLAGAKLLPRNVTQVVCNDRDYGPDDGIVIYIYI
jgi:hypothetical protein